MEIVPTVKTFACILLIPLRGLYSVTVIVIVNGIGDPRSNPKQG